MDGEELRVALEGLVVHLGHDHEIFPGWAAVAVPKNTTQKHPHPRLSPPFPPRPPPLLLPKRRSASRSRCP
eukprot:14016345-Alexandrium_andersonii.AAC.1